MPGAAQDNPVGTGYSYVEDDSLFVTSDWQQAADMTTVVRALVKEVPTLATSPLFLVAESYGGKYAATLGASVARAVRAGELKITLAGNNGACSPKQPISQSWPNSVYNKMLCLFHKLKKGVALGDSFVSPVDFTVRAKQPSFSEIFSAQHLNF